jgi:NAD(P)-dependent dehydrogenase (short-subunit alcohol dehydrogenase family)
LRFYDLFIYFTHLNVFSTADMNDDKRKRIALVTEGNRGLVYETCRQLAQFGLKVLLGACDLTKGKSAAYQLYEKEGLDVMFYQLDVSNQKSVYSMAKEVNQLVYQQFTDFDYFF